jgi:kinesin family protein 3/17
MQQIYKSTVEQRASTTSYKSSVEQRASTASLSMTSKLKTTTLSSHDERIKVFVRVRPLVDREIFQQGNNEVAPTVDTLDKRVSVQARSGTSKCVVDGVFSPTTKQTEVYAQVKDCVMSVTEGFNATCFAYGQTGSGKTFTMFGDDRNGDIYSSNDTVPDSAGIIPRAVRDVLSYARRKGETCTCFVSFMQIYNEQVFDLLKDPSRAISLTVKEDSRLGIYVEGLSEFNVESEHDVLRLLRVGDNRRAVRATRMNDMSSRSHSVFQMVLEQRRDEDNDNNNGSGTNKLAGQKRGNGIIRSKLNLVDLAGCERMDVHHDIAQVHISELTNINLSLHTLGRCIEALAKKNHTYVPYRESKLTRLLQDSLGGSAKTRLFAMMSPSTLSAEEAQATLRFADCAKRVMQHVTIKETRAIDHVLVARLEREVQELRAKLAAASNNGGGGGGGTNNNGNSSLTVDTSSTFITASSSSSSTTSSSTSATTSSSTSLSPKAPSSSASPPAPPKVRVIASSAVLEQLEKYRTKCKQFETVLEGIDVCANRFFRFEIEEEQLENELKEYLHTSKQLRRKKIPTLLPKEMVASSSNNGNGNNNYRSTSKPSPLMPRRRNGNQTPTVGMKYRIRGSTDGPKIRKAMKSSGLSTSSSSSTSSWVTDEEKEEVLAARLKEANRKMAKQKKLQLWLAEKAKKEQDLLDEHLELEKARNKAVVDAEERRKERNKENKAKLTSWRQQQINELNSLLSGPENLEGEEEGDRPPPDW